MLSCSEKREGPTAQVWVISQDILVNPRSEKQEFEWNAKWRNPVSASYTFKAFSVSADAAQRDLPTVWGNPQEEGPKFETGNVALEYLGYSPVSAAALLSNITDFFLFFFLISSHSAG